MSIILLHTCPFCGHLPDPDDYADSLHPTGQGWRDDPFGDNGAPFRHYMRRTDPRGVHGEVWEAGCLEHEGGCGARVTGDSREEAIAAWNRRPEVDASIYINGQTIAAWLRTDGTYQVATPDDDPTDLMDQGFDPVIKVPPSAAFALPEK